MTHSIILTSRDILKCVWGMYEKGIFRVCACSSLRGHLYARGSRQSGKGWGCDHSIISIGSLSTKINQKKGRDYAALLYFTQW